MVKKTELAVVERIPESSSAAVLPDPFDMVLDLPADLLVARAVDAVNMSERLNIGAGLCLLKAKELCSTESVLFEKYLAANGFSKPRAYELMAIAEVLKGATDADRKRLIQQPKTALIGLARMDGEIRQSFLDEGKLDERLTLNEYKVLLARRDADAGAKQAKIETLTAQLRTAELTGRKALDVHTPLLVAQVRREAASYAQDALACVQGFTGLGERLQPLDAEATTRQWVTPAALSLVSLLQAVQGVVEHQLQTLVEQYELNVALPPRAELYLAVPGPEEAELIRTAMLGVLAGFEAQHNAIEYAQYKEQRKAVPERGAMRKAPGEGKTSKAKKA